MSISPTLVEHRIDVDVPVEVVWAAVSDPASYGRWSPEATGARYHSEPPLRVGDRFTGRSRVWVPWSATCTVVIADPGRAFGFDARVGGVTVSRWTYETRPNGLGATTVVHRWEDLRRGLTGRLVRHTGVLVGRGPDAARRNAATMTETLVRLKADLEREHAAGR